VFIAVASGRQSRDVGFLADFVCFTPDSRRGSVRAVRGNVDPTRK